MWKVCDWPWATEGLSPASFHPRSPGHLAHSPKSHVPPWRWLTFLVALTLCLVLCQSLVYPWDSFPPMGMSNVAVLPISQIKRQRSREAKASFLWSQTQQVGSAGTRPNHQHYPPFPCHWPSGAATACQPPTGFIFSMSQWVLHENTGVYSQCRKWENVLSAWGRGNERGQHQTEEGWEETWPQVHRRPNDLRESCTRSAATEGKS